MVKDLHLEQEEEDFENARDQEVKKIAESRKVSSEEANQMWQDESDASND
ncbi:hypothetical protein WCE14_04415 [Acinetobacter schindleri]